MDIYRFVKEIKTCIYEVYIASHIYHQNHSIPNKNALFQNVTIYLHS